MSKEDTIPALEVHGNLSLTRHQQIEALAAGSGFCGADCERCRFQAEGQLKLLDQMAELGIEYGPAW